MKSLVEYITEAKAPVFSNDAQGVKEFCEYAVENTADWVVNPDNTITITPKNSNAKVVYVDLGDLKELPNFIVFKDMENTGIQFHGKQMETLVPNIKGAVKSLYVMDCKKVKLIDFSNATLTYDMYVEKNLKLEQFIGPKTNGQVEKISIRLNKHLSSVDLSGMREWAHYSSVNKNGGFKMDQKMMPKKKADNAFVNVD